ncbi:MULTISPECIES: TetR/AcrR family transcriptional regulator [unclassified Leucobacter]|uniref:TetR/AcrR family transcriptional regulator n=1 Tax=unclassified Leucobacter TaxID=2621730 RepID=UPI000C4287F4|nr:MULTISPECIES: TetR/AcrR family transcriptional regulator [unclassified Leucobacter]PIJ47773.1 hypothetical protein BMH30_06765 [Leucobacter sp. OLES1]
MTKSAESSRERRMRHTRLSLTENARRLTAKHGMNGFTVEELCEIVGISRRTFFNYFHTKEDAIIGRPSDAISDELAEWFVARGTGDAELGPALMNDLVEVSWRSFDEMLQITGSLTDMHALLEKEPEFMTRLIRENKAQHEMVRALIAKREGLEPEDPRVQLALMSLMPIVLTAAGHYFATVGSGAEPVSMRGVLEETLAQVRRLFRDPDAPIGGASPNP